ncbi:hypothetical protein BGZ49_010484 [Haplosporangium sp. Z 27]|nr:hypothetical protein BGZ49_010484 [Haplosporangium sp. Z 27]
MTAIATSSVRMIRAPLQAAARRQYSASTSAASKAAGSTQLIGHSNQRLAIVSAVSAVAGVDVTYAYFTYFKTMVKLSLLKYYTCNNEDVAAYTNLEFYRESQFVRGGKTADDARKAGNYVLGLKDLETNKDGIAKSVNEQGIGVENATGFTACDWNKDQSKDSQNERKTQRGFPLLSMDD